MVVLKVLLIHFGMVNSRMPMQPHAFVSDIAVCSELYDLHKSAVAAAGSCSHWLSGGRPTTRLRSHSHWP